MECKSDGVCGVLWIAGMQDGFEAGSLSPQSDVDYRPTSVNDQPGTSGYEAPYNSGRADDGYGAQDGPRDAGNRDATGGGDGFGANGGRKPKTCFRCGGTGHINSICPTKPDFVPPADAPKCYSCNGV